MRLHDLTAKHSELLLGCVGSGGREDMAFKLSFLPGQTDAFLCTYQVKWRASRLVVRKLVVSEPCRPSLLADSLTKP